MGCTHGTGMVKSNDSSEISVLDTDTKIPFHRRHLVTRRLARGSYTRVYAAYRYEQDDAENSTEVVVKIRDLRPKRKNTGQDSASKAAFAVQKEAGILARVSRKENCVSCVDHCVEGHFSYLVMEKCDMTLQQMFEQLPVVTESVLASTFAQMLHGLASIHEAGIVHRDVKPDSFLISGDSVVKLSDFVLAEVLSPQRPELKGVTGTAPFMSPEMLSGMFYDTKTDIWSFAVSTYVLLLGQFPYCPAERTSASMKQAIVDGLPKPAFTPKIGVSETTISEAAMQFLRKVLDRNAKRRIAAKEALQLPWLAMVNDASAGGRVHDEMLDLKALINSARMEGAFTPGSSSMSLCSMEVELATLQAKYHGEGATIDSSLSEVSTVAGRRGYTESSVDDASSSSQSTDTPSCSGTAPQESRREFHL